MSYDVKAEPEVDQDVSELVERDREAALAALRLLLELRENPWLGEDLRERYNLRALKDCRRIRFDRQDWKGKPRFRIVYRNEPEDGAPALVRVWALGPREDLVAYARAAARIVREQTRRRRRRDEH